MRSAHGAGDLQLSDALPFAAQETAWIGMIHKMDETHADLSAIKWNWRRRTSSWKSVALDPCVAFTVQVT